MFGSRFPSGVGLTELMEGLLYSLWFLSPAMAANLALYLLGVIWGKELGPSLDLGMGGEGSPLVGRSRTFIGLPACAIVATAVGLVQGRPWEGLILGLGVEIGTVVHSFFKRRKGLVEGVAHKPWDHLDYCLGALVAYGAHWSLPPGKLFPLLLVGGGAHWLASLILRPLLDKP